jgi:hypothetical protein
MRRLPFIVLLALTVTLGGCASSSTTGVCARGSDRDLSRELAWPSFPAASQRRKNARAAFDMRPAAPLAKSKPAEDETQEPRFTSAEWWMRENARLRRATNICQGCLAAVVATVTSPKPAVLSHHADLEDLSSSSTDRSIAAQQADRP